MRTAAANEKLALGNCRLRFSGVALSTSQRTAPHKRTIEFEFFISPFSPLAQLVRMLRSTRRESRGATELGLDAFHARTAETLNHVKQCRYDEDGDRTGSTHASDHGRSHDLARYGAGPGGTPKRHTTQNECEGRHQDGAQAQPGTFKRGVRKGLTFFVIGLRKLDDKDGILGRKSDQHDQPDLSVHVIFEA